MKTKARAFSYLRVSGKGQIDGDGFPRQRESIGKFAKGNGIEVVEEFRDEGVTGCRELERRAGLAALLDRIESNGVRMVLVERADRLARDLMIGEVILDQFRTLGVVVLAADGVDLTAGDNDPTRVLIRQVLGAVAQFEKDVIVSKLRAARERIRSRTGRCEGRKPFGHSPAEAATLGRIRQLLRKPRGGKRQSYADIADTLNRESLPTRTGKLWKPGTVYAIHKRIKGELE